MENDESASRADSNKLIVECAAVNAALVREKITGQFQSILSPDEMPTVTQRIVRGSDAVSLVQISVDIVLHVDVGKVLLGIAAILATVKARVILAGRTVRIASPEDVRPLIAADQSLPLLSTAKASATDQSNDR